MHTVVDGVEWIIWVGCEFNHGKVGDVYEVFAIFIALKESENSAPTTAKKIKIGNVSLVVDFDAEAVYRFSSVKGSCTDLQAAASGTEEGKASAFAEVVNLAWAMLSGEDRLRFARPEKMAHLFLPYPSAEVVKQLVEVFIAGSDAIGFKAE